MVTAAQRICAPTNKHTFFFFHALNVSSVTLVSDVPGFRVDTSFCLQEHKHRGTILYYKLAKFKTSNCSGQRGLSSALPVRRTVSQGRGVGAAVTKGDLLFRRQYLKKNEQMRTTNQPRYQYACVDQG